MTTATPPATEHPYRAQPASAFWRQTVQQHHFLEIPSWYRKKWPIGQAAVATAGSCFAQHIGRHLRRQGFNFLDAEPAPPALPEARTADYGYGIYSARYGNVYTTRQLLQLLQRALGEFHPHDLSWQQASGAASGFVDPFRPTIEPPLPSPEAVHASRTSHLYQVARLLEKTEVFVFTLGLTEAWLDRRDGAVFPICPGTHGGQFDPALHRFENFGFSEVLSDLQGFMDRARSIRPGMRFLLTVSPVPLAATATDQQVAVATSYSKSVLRAVAGQLAQTHDYVDYFPSYEIIASPVMRGNFYGPDARTVVSAGVEHVMRAFFAEHEPPAAPNTSSEVPAPEEKEEEVICEEALLAAFGPGSQP